MPLFPAYAGVIPAGCRFGINGDAFPRIRGGDPKRSIFLVFIDKLFPAYAGVILEHGLTLVFIDPFPRIRGGDPRITATFEDLSNFSPHTRG